MNNTASEKLKRLSELFLGYDSTGFQYSGRLFYEKVTNAGMIRNSEFSSVIIPPSHFPYCIAFNQSLLQQMENWLKYESPVSAESAEQYFKLKDLYVKWLEAGKEQDIFRAANAIKEAYRNNPDSRNFPMMLLFAFFFVFEGKNSRTSLELIQGCKREIDNQRIDAELRKKLNYILELLFGVYYYRESDFSYAGIKFQDAMKINHAGIEAKYLAALSDLKNGYTENASAMVKEILLFDLERMSYIIEKGYSELYEFFYRNPEIVHVFSVNAFDVVAESIESAVMSFTSYKKITPELIRKKINELKKLQMEDIYLPGVTNSLEFIEQAITKYKHEKCLLHKICLFYLHERLLQILKLTSALIRTEYEKFVERRIERNESEMGIIRKSIEIIEERINIEKGKSKDGLEKALLDLSVHTRDMIDYNVELLDKLASDAKINPVRILKRSLITGTVLSAGVAVMNYIASLSADSGAKPETAVSVSIKLGVISVVITFIFSIIIFAGSFLEKARRRNVINKKIADLNTMQISEGERIKKREQLNLDTRLEKLDNEIDEKKKMIKKYEADILYLEKEIKLNKDEKISWYQSKLQEIASLEE